MRRTNDMVVRSIEPLSDMSSVAHLWSFNHRGSSSQRSAFLSFRGLILRIKDTSFPQRVPFPETRDFPTPSRSLGTDS